MKLVQIAGYLGSGKTTLVLALGKRLSMKGLKCAILVNDVGAVPVDGKVMEEFGLTVKDIGGGCICCQMANSLLKTLEILASSQNPDIIIIEPTGVAVPSSINETAKLMADKIDISFGPIIVLFDTTRARKLMAYETLKRLVAKQLESADIIALSKVDMASDEQIAFSEESVKMINKDAAVIRLSTQSGVNINQLVDAVIEKTVIL